MCKYSKGRKVPTRPSRNGRAPTCMAVGFHNISVHTLRFYDCGDFVSRTLLPAFAEIQLGDTNFLKVSGELDAHARCNASFKRFPLQSICLDQLDLLED